MNRSVDAVLGYHLNPLTCGVAKFNLVLARRLGVPVVSLFDPQALALAAPLLSVKVDEFSARAWGRFVDLLDTAPWRQHMRLFLHAWTNTVVEHRLLRQATIVYAANAELAAKVLTLRADVVEAWCPSTLDESQRMTTHPKLSVFCFGMAHKIRTDLHDRLHTLLEQTRQSYSVYLSTALHEGTAFDERFTLAFEELRKVYGERIYFLGYLSDTAIYNYLLDTTFFAAFFADGVRANNTTVNAAMARGSVVITNVDAWSPPVFGHMHNMVDISQAQRLPTDPTERQAIGGRARATVSEALGWDRLIALVRMP